MALYFMLSGIALFFGLHTYSAFRSRHPDHDIRARREALYMGFYSVISLMGLVLIVQGYRMWGDAEPLYYGPVWTWWISAVVMLPALILFTAGNLPAGRIKAVVKHPMVMGTFLWAAVHLLTGFTTRSVLLFAPFAIWAAVDFIVASRRPSADIKVEAKWDVISCVGGVAAYAVLAFWAHEAWIGLTPVPY